MGDRPDINDPRRNEWELEQAQRQLEESQESTGKRKPSRLEKIILQASDRIADRIIEAMQPVSGNASGADAVGSVDVSAPSGIDLPEPVPTPETQQAIEEFGLAPAGAGENLGSFDMADDHAVELQGPSSVEFGPQEMPDFPERGLLPSADFDAAWEEFAAPQEPIQLPETNDWIADNQIADTLREIGKPEIVGTSYPLDEDAQSRHDAWEEEHWNLGYDVHDYMTGSEEERLGRIGATQGIVQGDFRAGQRTQWRNEYEIETPDVAPEDLTLGPPAAESSGPKLGDVPFGDDVAEPLENPSAPWGPQDAQKVLDEIGGWDEAPVQLPDPGSASPSAPDTEKLPDRPMASYTAPDTDTAPWYRESRVYEPTDIGRGGIPPQMSLDAPVNSNEQPSNLPSISQDQALVDLNDAVSETSQVMLQLLGRIVQTLNDVSDAMRRLSADIDREGDDR